MEDFDPKADYAKTLFDLTIDDHIKTMKVFQKNIDNAISKCVSSYDTMVIIDNKIFYLNELLPKEVKDDTFYDLQGSIENHKKIKVDIKSIYNNGIKDAIKLEFNDKSSLICTFNHKIYTENGWQKAVNINIGERI